MFTTTKPVPDDYEPELLKPALKELAAKRAPTERGPDRFPIFASDPLAVQHRVVSRYMVASAAKYDITQPRTFKVREHDGANEMLDADAEGRFKYLQAVVTRELWYWKDKVVEAKLDGTRLKGWRIESDPNLRPLRPLAKALLRNLEGPMPYDDVAKLLEAVTIEGVGHELKDYITIQRLMPFVIAAVAQGGIDDAMIKPLQYLRKRAEVGPYDQGSQAREKKELAEQIDGMFNPGKKKPKSLPVEAGEPWSNAAIELLQVDPKIGANWTALLEYAADSEASQPPQKWQKQAKPLVEAIGAEKFEKTLVHWLDLMLKPREAKLNADQLLEITFACDYRAEADLYSKRNERVIKGLAWIAGAMDRPAFATGLSALAERCYKKIPKIGPRSPKVANGCLVALTLMSGPEAAAQLSRLKAIVKQPTGRKMIDKALARMADHKNVSVEDLEEQNIPTYGLVDGVTERKIGPATLRIAISPTAEAEQTWMVDGKPRKSPPAELKTKHAEALKTLKRELTDIDKTLGAQRIRVERLFLRRSPWPFDAWLSAYHDHPLMRFFSRRLIWTFSEPGKDKPIIAAWDGKRFVDSEDKAVKLDTKKMSVSLWHPSSASANEVLAWRRWLERHEITQPFKQAHREVYLLTDAERRTATYSNRFAQHILRQHQFQALAQQRGWRYQLMGRFDFHNYPTIDIPAWKTKVELWVEMAEGGEMAASGVATHLTTDQVRFLDPDGEPQLLSEVPPLLLSELFRDVDLFVGVASVGNDPTWQDRREQNQAHTYWRHYSSADLSETGRTRRSVLESLLPRLTKLKDKWKLDEKFLVIKGSLRTYKIHLGSGNILMEPNDQYLCIVPDRSQSPAESVFLPFEGDTTLAIVLSKAFLLADDKAITDPSITRQIKPDS